MTAAGGFPRRRVRPGESQRVWLAFFLGASVGGGVALGRRPPAPTGGHATTARPEVALITPSNIDAGSPWRVGFGPLPQADGTDALLAVSDSSGYWAARAKVSSGWARFDVPSERTRDAGKVVLRAFAGPWHAESVVDVRPGAAVDPIVPLVGPRSIVADGEHTTMVVVIAADEYGNPVADGTAVAVRASHPGGHVEERSARVNHGLAWLRLRSRTVAGKADVSAVVEGKNGPRADLLEVPGWPRPFALSVSPASTPADGREWVTLHSDAIVDAHGNALLDGSAVTFVGRAGGLGLHFVQGYVVDGRVKVHLLAPPRAVPFEARAGVYGLASEVVPIPLAEAAPGDGFAVHVGYDAKDDAVTFRAGPLVGPDRHFVPDGTDVWFEIRDEGGRVARLRGEVDGGYADASLPRTALRARSYRVEVSVGGSSSAVAVNAGPG
jgi:Invasin, domain 3